MASNLKKSTRAFLKLIKRNALYLLTVFLVLLINAILIIYHLKAENYIIICIHITLCFTVLCLAIRLNTFKHSKSPYQKTSNSNRIYNIQTLNSVNMAQTKNIDVTSKNDDLKPRESKKQTIFPPPSFDTKVYRPRKKFVYFTLETHLINLKWCNTCRHYRSLSTIHCGSCGHKGTCIHNFDHHCVWLNNCIKTANYRLFVCYVVFMLATCYFAVFSVVDLFLLSKKINTIHIGVLFGFFSLLIVLGAVFTTILVIFHLYLRKRRLSTYQFVRLKYTDNPTNNTIYYGERALWKK